MVWTYDETDEMQGFNPPRERLAVAVSTDSGATWRYVMTIDDWEGLRYRFMNCAGEVIDGVLWVGAARRDSNGVAFHPQDDFRMRLWSIELDKVTATPIFPGTH